MISLTVEEKSLDSKDYITESDLKNINVCPGSKSALRVWILKNSITEIKKCVENSNTWKDIAELIFTSQKTPGWYKKAKKYFIKIINTYIDNNIIPNLDVRSKQLNKNRCRSIGLKATPMLTYEYAKSLANSKNFDLVWTKEEFDKNYTDVKLEEGKEKLKRAATIQIPLKDQLCGHMCPPVSLYQLGRKDAHGSGCPLSEIHKKSQFSPKAWMCNNKCRYKFRIYHQLLSFIKDLNVTITPFKKYFNMELCYRVRDDTFENILKLPCGHYISLSIRQINELLKRVPKQIEDYKLSNDNTNRTFHQTDPLRQKEESLMHLCKCCASKDEPNKFCCRCWKIVKNEDIRYGHRCCKPCQAIITSELRANYSLEQVIHELVVSKNSDVRVTSGRIKCNITDEIIMRLWKKQKGICALSGVKMNWTFGSSYKISIDRIDSVNGNYVEGEIQLVCAVVNTMKFDLDQEVFIKMCENVALYSGSFKLEE